MRSYGCYRVTSSTVVTPSTGHTPLGIVKADIDIMDINPIDVGTAKAHVCSGCHLDDCLYGSNWKGLQGDDV